MFTKKCDFLNNEISLRKKGNNGCLPITQVVIQQKSLFGVDYILSAGITPNYMLGEIGKN
jgi:hypothetical protein